MPGVGGLASRFAEHTKDPRERCVDLLRLLVAVDAFPRGGLCGGYYALCAALRYLQVWQPSLVKVNQQDALPPLDVAWAWLVARQQPIPYRALGSGNGPYTTAFQFGVTMDRDRRCWAEAVAAAAAAVKKASESGTAGAALAGQAPWPPPPPVTGEQPWAGISAELMQEAVKLAEDMQRFSSLLRSWLRPQFLDSDFLTRAQVRYSQFLELHALHPHASLVPTADIALMWHTHMALHGEYARSCGELFSVAAATPAAPAPQQRLPAGTASGSSGGGAHPPGGQDHSYLFSPDYLRLRGIQLEAAFAETARLYEDKYGEPYLGPDVAWIPPGEAFPAARPAGPLSALLDVFNAVPAGASAAAAGLAQQVPSTRLQWHAAVTPRAGGHALYALWLIARTLAEGPPFPRPTVRGGPAGAQAAVEAEAATATCCGCFGAPRRQPQGERVMGLASVALPGGSEVVGGVSAPKLSVLSDLFSLAIGERIGLLYHMRLLPAWSGHPFFACVRERAGVWAQPAGAVVSPSKAGGVSAGAGGDRFAAVVIAAAGAAAPDRLASIKDVRFETAEPESNSPPPRAETALLSPPPPPQEATENRVWEPAPSACKGGSYALTDCERFLDPTAPLGPRLVGLAEALGGPADDGAPAPTPMSSEAPSSSSQSGRSLTAGNRRLLGRRSDVVSRRFRGSFMRRAKGSAASGGSCTDAGEATRRLQDLLRKRRWLVEARRAVRERAEEPFDPHVRGLRYTPGSASLTEGAGLGLPADRRRAANSVVGARGAEPTEDGAGEGRAVRNIPDVFDLEVALQVVAVPAEVLTTAVSTPHGAGATPKLPSAPGKGP
ncbi:hypothetical protein HXX76_003795 [Chlamydomonas incerta]|uniref:Uncharacterized protein n=1 Tax=Chlamydomonas incerta TaxID=51695 RepID=A0A835TC47_CHLIN|nr:hypothetical protein HXX76_003795 [Chlamydomonas incerta]|eukprot:KAG2440942.1 hypothetical protein HXX76_003795 [Chlamydomonas incerta]